MKASQKTTTRRLLSGGAAIVALGVMDSAAAQEPAPATLDRAMHASVESRDFGDDRGTLNSVNLEFQFENADTTIIANSIVGELKGRFASDTAAGFGVTVFRRFDANLSTRTRIALAESEPVFAHVDLAQDVTFALAPATAMTLGVRWAQYDQGRDVYFLSAGVRYYFAGGSIAYRASYIDPENRESVIAHLLNLSLNDPSGAGKTQLWLSAGSASFETPLADDFVGEDYAVSLRRVQPLNSELNITGSLGFASYDRPAGRDEGTTLGLGVELRLQ